MYLAKRVNADDTGEKLVDGTEGITALVRNRHATASCYLGGSDVTILTGYELSPGESLTIELGGRDDDLYAITAATVIVPLHVLVNS